MTTTQLTIIVIIEALFILVIIAKAWHSTDDIQEIKEDLHAARMSNLKTREEMYENLREINNVQQELLHLMFPGLKKEQTKPPRA